MENLLYRLRSVDQLLDGRNELERSQIYFASPIQLNDPLEGLRDVYWQGDKTVWDNLLQHYIWCLEWSMFCEATRTDDYEISPNSLPIEGFSDQNTFDAWRHDHNDLVEEIFRNSELKLLIDNIVSRNRSIRRSEMFYFVQMMHPHIYSNIYNKQVSLGV